MFIMYSGQRLATGSLDGTITIYDLTEPDSSSTFNSSSKFKASEVNIDKVVWSPPEYGDAIACVCGDGIVSLWEEVSEEDAQLVQRKLCKLFETNHEIQFGISSRNLKLVMAYSDGQAKVYEMNHPLELQKWQLPLCLTSNQAKLFCRSYARKAATAITEMGDIAEFQNVVDSESAFEKPSCLSASISWNQQRGEGNHFDFVLGFNSDLPQFNSSKSKERNPKLSTKTARTFLNCSSAVVPVAELALGGDKGDQVYSVAWAPNIGRPYEVVDVATHKGIAMWHLGLNPGSGGRLFVEKVALLSGHEGEMEWDMSGMTLATTGSDGVVRLWQSNLNGVWHEQAALET
ncbi:hypothetical protein C5167_042596 [Papaver somniferum]|uniref:Uncharacterized protein n=1 Tax=Papaver somniferum TaxID=3469 RepID=A0A4Y7L383_PAPSO|nr:hypothetical protein C5167_042596 [Papaver somniferum]